MSKRDPRNPWWPLAVASLLSSLAWVEPAVAGEVGLDPFLLEARDTWHLKDIYCKAQIIQRVRAGYSIPRCDADIGLFAAPVLTWEGWAAVLDPDRDPLTLHHYFVGLAQVPPRGPHAMEDWSPPPDAGAVSLSMVGVAPQVLSLTPAVVILFDHASTELPEGYTRLLTDLAALAGSLGATVFVEGHACPLDASSRSNLRTAWDRAEAVVDLVRELDPDLPLYAGAFVHPRPRGSVAHAFPFEEQVLDHLQPTYQDRFNEDLRRSKNRQKHIDGFTDEHLHHAVFLWIATEVPRPPTNPS